MKIFINPGHCPGVDPGAVNSELNLSEATIVLDIGKLVKEYLEDVGYEVALLQSDNLCGENPAYPNICQEANDSEADLFISIHCNACVSHNARGVEVEVYNEKSQGYYLASRILKDVVEECPTLWERNINARPDLAVLRYTNMPAVLVECAFIDNWNDAQILLNEYDNIARGIALGVTDYVRDFY